MVVRIESAAGEMIAEPSPCSAREPISAPSLQARPDSSEATAEDDEAGEEDAPPSEQVGGAPAEQQEAAEEQRVCADDPLEVLLREAEVGLDRGKRDVHDRDVEHDHELHGAKQGEREPLCVVTRSWEVLRYRRRHGLAKVQRLLSFCKYDLSNPQATALQCRAVAKRFDQYCPMAHALSLIGDRWSLLLVRELLKGPKRYTDLGGRPARDRDEHPGHAAAPARAGGRRASAQAAAPGRVDRLRADRVRRRPGRGDLRARALGRTIARPARARRRALSGLGCQRVRRHVQRRGRPRADGDVRDPRRRRRLHRPARGRTHARRGSEPSRHPISTSRWTWTPSSRSRPATSSRERPARRAASRLDGEPDTLARCFTVLSLAPRLPAAALQPS